MKTMKRVFSPESICAFRSGLLAVLLLGGTLGLSACNRHEDPAETAQDMSEARNQGTEKVREATEEAAEGVAEGASVKEAATDAYKVEAEKIRADYEVAKERCDGVAEPDKEKCRKDAETAYETAMNALKSKRDAVVTDETPTQAPAAPPATPMGPP